MGTVLAVNQSGFFGRFSILNTELKAVSLELAEGCVEAARLKLANNSSYLGDETITIGANTCRILPIETSGVDKVIKAQANPQNVYTNLKITVKIDTLKILDREEVATL